MPAPYRPNYWRNLIVYHMRNIPRLDENHAVVLVVYLEYPMRESVQKDKNFYNKNQKSNQQQDPCLHLLFCKSIELQE